MKGCEACGFASNPPVAVRCQVCGEALAQEPRRGRRAPKGPWLRHLLCRVGSAPIELTPDEPFTIGRGTECDLVIPSQRVSRVHAELRWVGGRPVVRDLGSQNGTLVGGRAVTEHRLEGGEELVVGPYRMTYRCVPGEGSVTRVLNVLDESARTQLVLDSALEGRLEELSALQLLSSLELHQRSGTLELFDADGDDALVVVREGRPVHARVGERTGDEALLLVVQRERGRFAFSCEPREVPENVSSDATITGTSLEAGQRLDERLTRPLRSRDLGFGDLGDLDDEG